MDILEFYKNNKIDMDFDEHFYAARYPETKDFYQPYCKHNNIDDKHRLYFHYMNYSLPKDEVSSTLNVNKYIYNINQSLFKVINQYEQHKNSIILVNSVSNLYGASHHLFSLYKYLQNQGYKVCILDAQYNVNLYNKYKINNNDIISYKQNLLLLCYIYEKLQPKIFYINGINICFVQFIKLYNHYNNIIIHSHEPEHAYGRYGILPTYVVSDRIQNQFYIKHNYRPEIQQPIFLDDTLSLIDSESKKNIPAIINSYGYLNHSKITIGMCGQTENRKNPNLFIEISKIYPQYNFLWIGGTANYFPSMHNIYHIPEVSLPYIYYKAIDYFILFSEEDPCPYVVLENLYINNKVITFKNNIYTDHKQKIIEDIYFEFDGSISIENLCKVIDIKVQNKTKRNGCGPEYIRSNFMKLNPSLLEKLR